MTTGNGPAASTPPPANALRTLSPAECLALLEPGGVGRIGFASSVLVLGHARKSTAEHGIGRLQNWTDLRPWAAGGRDVYVCIAPAQISGRWVGD